MSAMNGWILYSKDGRCAYIPYGADYTVWGVLPQAGQQPANENTAFELHDMGSGNIAFMAQRSVWASARDDYYGRVQFQSPNGDWISSPQGDEMFRAVPTGDGYFVLFSNHMGQYVYISGTLDTISNTYPMVAGTNLAGATRFSAVSVNNRPPVLDFLQIYNNASGLSFAGVGSQLANRNLSQANLSNCDLTDVTPLTGCILNGANLQQAKLTGLHLAGASLSAADFTNAHLDNCVFADLGPATDTTVIQSATPYAQGDEGAGIADCKMADSNTEGFAFDFDSSGKPDHLVFYHPGQDATSQKALYIIKSNGDDTFTTRYSGDNIGDFNLTNHANVRGFAFDFESSGKLDHLVFYCPGEKIVYIFKSNGNGTFTQRYPTQANPVGTGIGGYDLAAPADQGFAFDYEGTGKLNYLVFFRPTRGAIFIIKSNGDGTFTPVYQVGDAAPPYPASPGIGGCQFLDPNTRGFAFDLTGSGNLDHLVFYYPSQNSVYVIQNQAGTFTAIYPNAGNPAGTGLAGFTFNEQHIRGFAFDFEGSGKQDYLFFYVPGQHVVAFFKVNKEPDGTISQPIAFSQPYSSSQGIGGYDLTIPEDLAFPFDYGGTGKLDYITLYRPGRGAVFITKQKILSGLYPILEQAQLSGATLSTPMPGAQMAGANLAGATLDCDLSGADLSGGVVLTGATITSNCDLTGANLSGAHMAGLDLTKVKSLRNANLSGADLTGAKLQGVDLTGAILEGTKLCNMDLTQTTFSQPISRSTDTDNPAGFIPTSFANSTLPYAVIGLDWSYLDLTGTTLVGIPTDLSGLQATWVKRPNGQFTKYTLNKVDFSYATLTGAMFTGAHLDTVHFYQATMNDTKFNNATLNQVTFIGATLGGLNQTENTQFTRAYLSSCDFSGANLYGVEFTNATLESSNTFKAAAILELVDFSGAYLAEVDLSNATLTGAKFQEACMVRVILSSADLSPGQDKAIGSSLVGAFLQGAQFNGTKFQGANLENAVFTDKAGSIQEQHYGEDGKLTEQRPLPYRSQYLPTSACFDNDTVCPNGYTYGYNIENGVTIADMLKAKDTPPTLWTPPITDFDT